MIGGKETLHCQSKKFPEGQGRCRIALMVFSVLKFLLDQRSTELFPNTTYLPISSWLTTQSRLEIAHARDNSPAITVAATISANL